MNFKQFYEEVSDESGYDPELIRVVWNNFWKCLKSNTLDNVIIDIDNFGLFHIDVKRLQRYIKRSPNPRPEFVKLNELMMKEKRLTKYLENGQDDGPIS